MGSSYYFIMYMQIIWQDADGKICFKSGSLISPCLIRLIKLAGAKNGNFLVIDKISSGSDGSSKNFNSSASLVTGFIYGSYPYNLYGTY